MERPNVLFLADTTHPAQAVSDHIKAITSGENIHWHVMNPIICKTIDKLELSIFDAIGIHYSIKPYNHYYLSRSLREKITAFQGTKFLFLQDEYQKVNQVQEYLYALKFNILFTLVDEKKIHQAYPDTRLAQLKKIQVLTGYVSDEMKQLNAPKIIDRSIDVSYRGRRCEYWLGKLAHEKEWIASEFLNQTKNRHLNLDISIEEADRVYGDAWLRLLMNSKAVLGTESGASIWDFDGTIQKKTHQYLKKYKGANFTSVYEHVLKPYDGKIVYNAISPRVFEAAATRTPMIMFPGDYSGVCKPGVHYILLEKDFSNLQSVLAQLKDIDYLQAMADKAHEDLIQSDLYSQRCFATLVSEEILTEIKNNKHALKESPQNLTIYLKNKINKHKNLNRIRCFYTEMHFISYNLISLLFDPRESFFRRVKTIANGFKRYLCYLLPRLKKQ